MSARSSLRLMIADVDPQRQLFTDAQVDVFLALYGVTAPAEDADTWLVRRAAAEALDTIAVSEVLVGKVIRTQDLSTDGAKVAAALHAQADRLRTRANDEEADADEGASFDVVEFHPWRV